ncbi:uncharacterized protein FFB20_12527 [Fusarium fujikuroi]|nr:uncharacterized protein FPRN_10555 [Fusarium proliferatum]SCO06268.1 uncharacterized protein FFB20_12527 [Fusarium fujikuroi]SCO11281.1 uncharacterized protein FFE2_12276 [Fusarium fujikuroi]SCO19940.1 uncharacterized protein FFM5_12169 [Fusarium fujikuroi]SCO23382.1 uncharacterized protein FFC1_14764 [Fusarium fujikuroi]
MSYLKRPSRSGEPSPPNRQTLAWTVDS